MKCDFFRENIDALLDDALAPALAEEMWRHCGECPECAALKAEAEALRDEMLAMGREEAPPLFLQSMKEAVRKEAKRSGQGRKLTWKAMAGIAAAAVVVICLPVLGVFSGIIGSGGAAGYGEYGMDENEMARSQMMAYTADMAAMPSSAPMSTAAPAPMIESYDGGYSSFNSMAGGGEMLMEKQEYAMEDSARVVPPVYPTPEPEAGNNAHGLKIIKTGSISLETYNFDVDYQGIQNIVAQYGGYVESMSVSGTPYASYEYRPNRWGNLTVRIPSESLDAFINETRGTGNVTDVSIYSEDVTARYQDTELRLQTLYTQHERIIELVRQATEIDDLIALEQKLADLQYQIDSLTGSLRGWDARVDYSTVHIYVSEVKAYTSTETDSLSERMAKALQSSIEGVKELARSIAVSVAAALPYAAVLLAAAAVVFVVILITRAARKKRG